MNFEYMRNHSLTRIKDLFSMYSGMTHTDVVSMLMLIGYMRSYTKELGPKRRIDCCKNQNGSQYKRMCPIMWDVTNFSTSAFSSAYWWNLSWNQCYTEDCFKSGVFCQTCAWIAKHVHWWGLLVHGWEVSVIQTSTTGRTIWKNSRCFRKRMYC